MSRSFSLPFVLPVAVALLVSSAAAQPTFPDVPPCHWAADAVGRIAGDNEVEAAQARSSRYLAANAVRQVFEGLRCQTPEWSEAFLLDAPDSWPPERAVYEFTLSVGEVQLDGDRGSAQIELTAPANDGWGQRTGELELHFVDGGWKVSYPSLAALGLPLFP